MARTIPTLPTWTAGMRITGANLAAMVSYQQFFSSPPDFKMHQTVTQSLTSGSDTQIKMDVSDHDSESQRSGTTPWSYTIASGQGGMWDFYVLIAFAFVNTTGARAAQLRVNGSLPTSYAYAPLPPVNGTVTVVPLPISVAVNAGDVVTAYGYQTSGGALSTYNDANVSSVFAGRLRSLNNP